MSEDETIKVGDYVEVIGDNDSLREFAVNPSIQTGYIGKVIYCGLLTGDFHLDVDKNGLIRPQYLRKINSGEKLDSLEGIKVIVNSPEQSKLVQEKLFKEGFSWDSGSTECQFLEEPFLFPWVDKTIAHGDDKDSFLKDSFKEVTVQQILEFNSESGSEPEDSEFKLLSDVKCLIPWEKGENIKALQDRMEELGYVTSYSSGDNKACVIYCNSVVCFLNSSSFDVYGNPGKTSIISFNKLLDHLGMEDLEAEEESSEGDSGLENMKEAADYNTVVETLKKDSHFWYEHTPLYRSGSGDRWPGSSCGFESFLPDPSIRGKWFRDKYLGGSSVADDDGVAMPKDFVYEMSNGDQMNISMRDLEDSIYESIMKGFDFSTMKDYTSTLNQLSEEDNTMKTDVLKTEMKLMINDRFAEDYSDDQLIAKISEAQEVIKSLEGLDTKSENIKLKIKSLQEDIDVLVKELDDRV